jgi:hypothetical protein
MTLLDKLQAHKGGLLRLKTQLLVGRGTGWDRSTDRVCLLLDALHEQSTNPAWVSAAAEKANAVRKTAARVDAIVAAHLLIDGTPQWIWVVEEDIERL